MSYSVFRTPYHGFRQAQNVAVLYRSMTSQHHTSW